MATTPQYFLQTRLKQNSQDKKTVFHLMAEAELDYSVSSLCLECHVCGMVAGWEEASVCYHESK